MATVDPNVVLLEQQPSPGATHNCEAHPLNDPFKLLHLVESLPMISQEIVDALAEGEAYETISRKIKGLHHNLTELSQQAKHVKRHPSLIHQ